MREPDQVLDHRGDIVIGQAEITVTTGVFDGDQTRIDQL
jgi:hypothetical protein